MFSSFSVSIELKKWNYLFYMSLRNGPLFQIIKVAKALNCTTPFWSHCLSCSAVLLSHCNFIEICHCLFLPNTICPAHHCSNIWVEDDGNDLLVQHDVQYQGGAGGVDVEHCQLVQLSVLSMEDYGQLVQLHQMTCVI